MIEIVFPITIKIIGQCTRFWLNRKYFVMLFLFNEKSKTLGNDIILCGIDFFKTLQKCIKIKLFFKYKQKQIFITNKIKL